MIKDKVNLFSIFAIVSGLVVVYWLISPSNFLLSLIPLAYFLFFPGYIIKKIVPIKSDSIIQQTGIILGISIFFLILIGFVLNFVGLMLNFKQPLEPIITRTVFLLTIIISGIYVLRKPLKLNYPVFDKNSWLVLFSFFFLLFSVIATTYLNNGHSLLVYISFSLLILSLLFIVKFIEKFSILSLGIYLFCFALALLFSFSLRSNFLIGWDIHQEYMTYQITNVNQSWIYSLYKNAYNACLSITILPKILVNLTKFDSVIFFKIFYNLVFAFVPILIFDKIAAIYSKKIAFFSVLPFILLTWFFEQFPSLSRQELAFLYLALNFIFLLEKEKLQKSQTVFLYILGLGLIISHYSTAYLWTLLIIVAYSLKLSLKLFLKIKTLQNLNISYIFFILISTICWYNLLFPTNKGLSGTLTEIGAEYSQTSLQDKLSYTIQKLQFKSNKESDEARIFQGYLIDKANSNSYSSDKYTVDQNFSYVPELVQEPEISSKLDDTVSLILLKIASISKIIVIIIFPIIGALILFIKFTKNKLTIPQVNLLLFSISSLFVIGIALLVPNLEKEYSITRLYSQLLIFSSILFGISCVYIYDLKSKAGSFLISILLIIYSLYSTELIFQLTGGPSSILYNNYGSAYNQYYTLRSDVFSALWVSNQNIKTEQVQSDIMASLRLKAYGLIDNTDYEIFPDTIRMSKYLYLNSTNVLKYITYRKYDGTTYSYKLPYEFIDEKKDLIYSNGSSKLYK